MSTSEHFLARLLELPRIESKSVRLGIVRQAIVALGMGDQGRAPMALAGVDPAALHASLRVAHADGTLEQLDFVSPAAAAIALYQIAGALPLGSERRAVGRKVLNFLYQGDAGTFAALASQMAMGSARPLQDTGVRARLSLTLGASSLGDPAIDRLALAMASRAVLADSWIAAAATGSLPERQLAGKILLRAAREASRRADAGDAHPLKLFRSIVNTPKNATPPRRGFDAIAGAWHALLADRETLVWRNVAMARGLLCRAIPSLVPKLLGLTSTDLSPTEWRRAATSLTARIAVDPEDGLADALDLATSPLLRRDSGIATAMVWALVPVAEVEPEAAEELLENLATHYPISIADSLVSLRRELGGGFGHRANELCAAALRNSLARPELDDGLTALAQAILDDLEDSPSASELPRAIEEARRAYFEKGSAATAPLAQRALQTAVARVNELANLQVSYDASVGSSSPRKRAMVLLREIDTGLLETRTLNDILQLARPPGQGHAAIPAIDDLDARLARWLLDPARLDASPDEIKHQATLQQRQLRTLLHLIDDASTDFGDEHQRRLQVRARWALAVNTFTNYVRKQPRTRLTRALVATVARACDALVRDNAADVIDVVLFCATNFSDPKHTAIVGEASMDPDVSALLSSYSRMVNQRSQDKKSKELIEQLAAFRSWLGTFPIHATQRAEAFRITAGSLARAIETCLQTHSLRALVPVQASGGTGTLTALEEAMDQLHQLVAGAERRCANNVGKQRVLIPQQQSLESALEHAVHTDDGSAFMTALTETARVAEATLPPAIASLVTQTVPGLAGLQVDRPSVPFVLASSQRTVLPDWLPQRRIVGGFHVMHQLGGGNVGTVFVVKRAEERHNSKAEQFALKVPEFNATAARTMSEAEFLKLFREEAGALLSIPDHPNIARFVTFDAGAKPKPILVMELIEGLNCERVINSASLDTKQAFDVLDGVAAGLDVMHQAGLAHLDIKPSNTVIRKETRKAVLVDFGLAGRQVRPGCATLCYGAPEVWEGAPPSTSRASKKRNVPIVAAADVYSFGCFAYELLTSQTLFDGSSDMAIISAHITHDGMPPAIQKMAENPQLNALAQVLASCLRSNPYERVSINDARVALQGVRGQLDSLNWPLRITS